MKKEQPNVGLRTGALLLSSGFKPEYDTWLQQRMPREVTGRVWFSDGSSTESSTGSEYRIAGLSQAGDPLEVACIDPPCDIVGISLDVAKLCRSARTEGQSGITAIALRITSHYQR